MKKVELLSPAKNLETAIAAINSGADAVYIGACDFGARVNASNTVENIEKLVNYAHKFYVRVHVTINTILRDEELSDALELIQQLYSIGVDAIIIQDMGILKAAIEQKIPPIQIHMSTQCNNRDINKIKFFDKIGVSRVILARELSLVQIEQICNNVGCEIETFIHGALCVSYSGQCYLSYANGGRSANKGACAQPCRKKYSLIDEDNKYYLKDKYLLSLKDFNASESITKLISCGVKSFKIEGRLKDINYVKNVTLYYNNLINKYAKRTSSGKIFTEFEPDVSKTFNRLFTDYFLNSRHDCYNFLTPKSMGEYIGKVLKSDKHYVEIDRNSDISSQDGIFYSVEDKPEGFMVNKVVKNKIYPNKLLDISVGTKLYRNYDSAYDKKLASSKIVRKIGVKFEVFDDKILATDEDLNSVCVFLGGYEYALNKSKASENIINQLKKSGESDFYVTDVKLTLGEEIPFLPVSKINELRRNILEKLMTERIRNYPKITQAALSYADFYEDNVDYRANVYNKEAENFYSGCNCRVKQYAIETSKTIPPGVELMRCKHCLRFAAGICTKKSKLDKSLYLMDENGKKYPLKFDCKNCEMVILNSQFI